MRESRLAAAEEDKRTLGDELAAARSRAAAADQRAAVLLVCPFFVSCVRVYMLVVCACVHVCAYVVYVHGAMCVCVHVYAYLYRCNICRCVCVLVYVSIFIFMHMS